MRQVFQRHRSLRAFGLGNDALCNHVVDIGLEMMAGDGVNDAPALMAADARVLPPVWAAAAQSLPDIAIMANSARLLRPVRQGRRPFGSRAPSPGAGIGTAPLRHIARNS